MRNEESIMPEQQTELHPDKMPYPPLLLAFMARMTREYPDIFARAQEKYKAQQAERDK